MSNQVLPIALRISNRIRQIRKLYGYTQEQLAESANLDYKHLQRLEGKKPTAVRIDTIEKIATTFDLEIHEFLNFDYVPDVGE